MKNFMYILGFLIPAVLHGQEITISGRVMDQETKEYLPNANIVLHPSGQGFNSNKYGQFSFSETNTTIHIEVSYIGYESKELRFRPTKDTSIVIYLINSAKFDEIIITEKKSSSIEESAQMSAIDIPIKQIKNVVALLGEVDVLKALQLLPGVQSGGEGQSGLYVRGGSPDQNLLLIDGVPIYNASHLFGFFSVFNADAIKDVKLIKGGFPARYGGRLSSVLDISMDEGDFQDWHGSAAIGLVASKAAIEGPLIHDKTSIQLAARRTYIDVLARPFISRQFAKENTEGSLGYFFYDLNGKITHKWSERNKLNLNFYHGSDVFYFRQKDLEGPIFQELEQKMNWGNTVGSITWLHEWNKHTFSKLLLFNSDYTFGVDIGQTEEEISTLLNRTGLDYGSGINDIGIRWDHHHQLGDHYLRMGIQGISHLFQPGTFNLDQEIPEGNINFQSTIMQQDIRTTELSLFLEDEWDFHTNSKFNYGLHLSSFSGDGFGYTSIQPRISFRQKINDQWSGKISFASMIQYVQLLAFEGVGLPTDLWLPTTDRIKPQDSWQAAMGIATTFGSDYELTIEGYYKKMENLISYKNGESIFSLSDWQDRVTQGDGEAYGVEWFIQKKRGKFNGWLGYTLAWTKRQFDELNGGDAYPFRYDRRHDISLVGNYRLAESWQLSSTWVYGSGNAITLGNGLYYSLYGGKYFTAETFPGQNHYRMRNYHRMDLGMQWIKARQNYTRTWSFGCYNAYSRKNPFYIYIDEERKNINGQEIEEIKLKQVSLFPFIPYFNYKIEF